MWDRLAPGDWIGRADAHQERADALLEPVLAYRRAGRAHPVYDFLFTYYNLRPRQLRWWHPGYGTVLTGEQARSYLPRAGYSTCVDGVAVSPEYLRGRADTVVFVADLLAATAARSPRFDCFGLHEWAMVYRSPTVRHGGVPLRLSAADTDAVVDSMPLRCTHFDAYRFFTEPAVGRNQHTPTRRTQIELEQPGCVHAGMDLYKWAYKLGPLIDSGLVLDCFELALAARVLDMQASPYDLDAFGFPPLPVETPAGRRDYAARQQALSGRAAPLRARLLEGCTVLREAAART